MQPNEHVVRKFAHQIWESEGKPDGQAARHWEMASKLAAGEVGPADPMESLTDPQNFKPADEQQVAKPIDGTSPFGPAEHEVTMASADPEIAPPPTRVRVKAVIDDPAAAPKKLSKKPAKPH